MAASVQGAQSFARTMDVLQQIADARRPLSRAELVQLSGLTRPTLYRIIASLESEGLIEANAENRYRLGGRLVSLMTTGAMVLGILPLALATGAGAAARNQIGWVIVGGMAIGTIFSLFVVPVFYSLFAKVAEPHDEKLEEQIRAAISKLEHKA